MIAFAVETEIARPPAVVFDHVTDPARLATWQTNTVSADPDPPGPLALGSRIREVHRVPGGRELPSVVEVSEYEPSRVFALRMIEGQLPVDARITLYPDGDGTRMRFEVNGRARGASRLLEPLLTRVLKRQFTRDCATLKRVLENG